MFEVHWHANKVEPITTVPVVPRMKQTLMFANWVLDHMDRSAVALVPATAQTINPSEPLIM